MGTYDGWPRAIAECSCHVWVVIGMERPGRCGRCREQPRLLGMATEIATTQCKHDGPCK